MAEFKQRSMAFCVWFEAQEGAQLHPDVDLVDLRDRGAGRGMVAKADIPAEASLFTVPRGSILTVANSALSNKLPEIFDIGSFDSASESSVDTAEDAGEYAGLGEIPTSWLSLILVMVYEHLQGSESKWKAYLDVLPQHFDTPMFWTDSELEELQGSDLRGRIGRGAAEKMFAKHIIPKVAEHANVFYPQGASKLSNEELLALAHRMGSTIMSYAFDMDEDEDDLDISHDSNEDESQTSDEEEQVPELVDSSNMTASLSTPNEELRTSGISAPSNCENGSANGDLQEPDLEDAWLQALEVNPTMGMVPMADMLNADAEFNAHLNHGEEQLTMCAIRPIAAGEEILNYYGPLSNSELLRRYGYTSQKHSRYDVVELPMDDVIEVFKSIHGNGSKIIEQVEEAGLDLTDSCVLEREAGDPDDDGRLHSEVESAGLPDELIEQVNLLSCLANGMSIERWEQDELTEKERNKVHEEMLQILPQVIERRLEKYGTSAMEDENLLTGSSQGENSRLVSAIRVRLGEKALLKEAMETLTRLRSHNKPSKANGQPPEEDRPNPKRRKVAP